MTKTTAIILAAGQGTRMKSPLPKVLHPVAGNPMILRILSHCVSADFDEARLVLGHGSQLVKSVVEPFSNLVSKKLQISIHQQIKQLGTADAVKSAEIESLEGDVIILNGDHPLITVQDLKGFLADFRELKLDLAVITVTLDHPKEFGRIIKSSGQLKAIV